MVQFFESGYTKRKQNFRLGEIAIIFEFIGDLLGSVGNSQTLNTRKIDQNIRLLNDHAWFKSLYEDEKYHRLFFVNRHVRAYLQSSFRVKKMIRNQEAQLKFALLLDKHFKSR